MWYSKVIDDISTLADCIAYFEDQLEDGLKELETSGELLETIHKRLASRTAYRYNQLQELDAIVKHFNDMYDEEKSNVIKNLVETSKRALTVREAEKFADGDATLRNYARIINNISLVRNKYLGLLKGFDCLNFQLGHITKLRVAGIEDAIL